MTRRIGFRSLLACLVLGAPASAQDAPSLKIGLPATMFRDVPPAVAIAIARPLRTILERQVGIAGDAEMVADAETIARRLNDETLHVGVFHGFEYAWVKARNPGLEPILITLPHGGILHATVVVRKDSTAKTLADLANAEVIIPRGSKAHCVMYLDEARKGLPATTAKPVPKPTQTNEDVLNAIAAGEGAAALIDAGAFAGYEKLQPGAANQLRVLCQSCAFPSGVLVCKKGALSADITERIRSGLTNADKTAQGKPLLMLWNLKGFTAVPADYSEQLAAVLKVYPAPEKVLIALPVKRDK